VESRGSEGAEQRWGWVLVPEVVAVERNQCFVKRWGERYLATGFSSCQNMHVEVSRVQMAEPSCLYW
jgi:hypothetical protein